MLSEAGNRKVEGEDGTRRAVVINGCVNIMKKTHSRWRSRRRLGFANASERELTLLR